MHAEIPKGRYDKAHVEALEKLILDQRKIIDDLGGIPLAEEWGRSEGQWFFVKEVVGSFAMWVIRQSPHLVPEGLEETCKELHNILAKKPSVAGMREMSMKDLRNELTGAFVELGDLIDRWNRRRFSSRDNPYLFPGMEDQKDADDDFIDIDALTRNICVDIWDKIRKDAVRHADMSEIELTSIPEVL